VAREHSRGSCLEMLDQRPKAVMVNWEALAAPWYALYADAMALGERGERRRRAASMQMGDCSSGVEWVREGRSGDGGDGGDGDDVDVDVAARRRMKFGRLQGLCWRQ